MKMPNTDCEGSKHTSPNNIRRKRSLAPINHLIKLAAFSTSSAAIILIIFNNANVKYKQDILERIQSISYHNPYTLNQSTSH